MKRRGVVAVVACLLASLMATGQAPAQQGPSITADPPAVPGEGTYDFTITGSGWTAGSVIFVVPCTVPGEQLTTAHADDAISTAISALTADDCIPVTGGDGGECSRWQLRRPDGLAQRIFQRRDVRPLPFLRAAHQRHHRMLGPQLRRSGRRSDRSIQRRHHR